MSNLGKEEGEGEGEGDARYFEVTPFASRSDPRHPSEEEREEDEQYDPPAGLPDGQVVRSREAGEDRRPDDGRFLSDRNQVVASQTRARFALPGRPAPTQPPPVPFSPGPAQPESPPEDPATLVGLLRRQRRLPLRDNGQEVPDQAPPPSPPSSLDLSPSFASLNDAVGGTGLDNLKGVDEGEENLLSTVRWRHAPFFHRVQDQVEQYWRPSMAFARHDPGGHVYGYRDRETVIRVVLDPDGMLVRAYVMRSSGAFFDDEALQAIERAASFPNPPRSLVDEHSQRIVFTFVFTVEVGEQPIIRLRRYR